MLKIDNYKPIKFLFYLLHLYIFYQIYQYNNDARSIVSLPSVFSAIISVFTYIIYIQSTKKSTRFLIYFLLSGSLAYLTSNIQSKAIFEAIIIFSISFQLSGWYFNKFITESLFDRRIAHRKKNKIVNLNPLFLLAVVSLDLYSIFSGNLESIANILFLLSFLYNVLSPLIKMIYYLIYSEYYDKKFLLWMLLIPIIGIFPFLFLHAIPRLIGDPILSIYTATWAFFFIPTGYIYLILAKKLLNIRFILNRTVYYGCLALLQTFFFMIALFWSEIEFNLTDSIQLFFILFLFNTMFFLVKEQLDYKYRDFLFHDRSNGVQFIERISNDLENCITMRELNNIIIREINKEFGVVNATIIKYNTSTKEVEYEYLIGKTEFEQILFNEVLERKNRVIIDYEGYIGVRLSKLSSTRHYLWIGNHKGNRRFNNRDKSWLMIFGSYLRFTYEMIRMNEESVDRLMGGEENTTTTSRFLFYFAETERKRLAEDIHNTILQDQIYIFRELDLITRKNEMTELVVVRDNLRKVIDKTRRTLEEIVPTTLLSKGLSYSLAKLFQRMQLRATFRLDFEVDIITERFEQYDKSIIIYRIIEEMINNSIKYSAADRVSFYIWETERDINIDYLDDGKGFDHKEALQRGRIGLNSVIKHVENMNGIIEFSTDNPKKVQIYITIPR